MALLVLDGSVGQGRPYKRRPHNDAADVAKVRDRLLELGFTAVAGVRRGDERRFINTIRVFRGLTRGRGSVYHEGSGRHTERGRIVPGDETHRWLAAVNAPRWVHIHGMRGPGWQKTTEYQHGMERAAYCSSWLLDGIRKAGQHYQDNYRSTHPDYPPMWIMDCSSRNGGNVPGHGSHETGIDVDMRLPLMPPHTDKWTNLGKKGFDKPEFHKDAGLAQLKSIKAGVKTQLVIFEWPTAVLQGLSDRDRKRNHDQHYHIRISPPPRQEGAYSALPGGFEW